VTKLYRVAGAEVVALDGVDREFPGRRGDHRGRSVRVGQVVAAAHPRAGRPAQAGEQVAFVLSSHDPRVVERSDHLLRLDRGRPVESW
jgi:hypothetical protein